MTDRTEAQTSVDGLAAKQGIPGTISPVSLSIRIQNLLDRSLLLDEEAAQISEAVKIGDGYELRVNGTNNQLAVIRKTAGVDELIGELGGGYTDQFVFTKAFGGTRFFNGSSGFEEFVTRREVSGDGLGASLGNIQSDTGNILSTSEAGGFSVCHKTTTQTVQQVGNPASTNYIESTLFTFDITSDQVLPYGALVRRFECETDVDFVDVPFDVRVYNAAGTEVYSDIQNLAVWEQDPDAANDPPFLLSSNSGAVIMPISQQFPMNSADTYKIEYRFKTAVRLKGDGVLPSMQVIGPRLEYYPLNYTNEVEFFDADFVAQTGGDYKVDTTNGSVVVSVHETVKSFWIGDEDETWTNSETVTLLTSGGNHVFGHAERKKRFQIVRKGNVYLIYKADGKQEALVPI